MSKHKELSRNKTIKLLHDQTGLSYKVCRATLKANNWDLFNSLGLNLLPDFIKSFQEATKEAVKVISNFINETCEAVNDLAKAFSEALSND